MPIPGIRGMRGKIGPVFYVQVLICGILTAIVLASTYTMPYQADNCSIPTIWYVGGEDIRLRIPLLKAFRKRGYRVAAVGSDGAREFREHGIRFFECSFERFINPLADARSKQRLFQLFQQHQPQIIHAFDTKPGILAPLAARQAGIPVRVRTINGLGFLYVSRSPVHICLRPLWCRLQRQACQASQKTIFQNPDDRDFFLKRRLVDIRESRLILGAGVDSRELSAYRQDTAATTALRRQLGTTDRLVITMISRIAKHKGIGEFFGASREVCLNHPDAHFLLIGPRHTEGRQAVTTDEIERHAETVSFLGFRTDIGQLLAGSDIFVLPSYNREGIPRSLMEAGAAGLPLITTNMPGCREVVKDRWNGYLIPPRDTRSLTDAILRLVASKEQRTLMGDRSRKRVFDHFDIERVVDAHTAVYSELLSATDDRLRKAA